MAVFYVHTFHAIGNSSDAKPVEVPEGMVFWELDSQKVYVYHAGQWKETKSGSGVWSASSPETFSNKTLSLPSNIVQTTSGTIGIFAFDATGKFVFVPKGNANQYFKTNSGATGFEWGDPAVSGSWNPTGTEEIQNKTIKAELNTIRSNTPAAGNMLLDNGTKYLPVVKGSIGQAWKVKSDGNVGWDTDQTGAADYSSLPSKIGYKQGWFFPNISFNSVGMYGFEGILRDNVYYEKYISSTEPYYQNNFIRGSFINMPTGSTASAFQQFKTNPIFGRDFSSYMLIKFRMNSVSATATFLMGFLSTLPTEFSSETVLNNYDAFVFGKLSANTNWRIFHNAATATATAITHGNIADTNPHTIELVFEAANNRIGYRLDSPGGAYTYISTNIPRTSVSLCGFISINGTSTTANALEIYDWECANKLMF